MTLEPWKGLIVILVEQLAILGVLILQAWESAREQQRHRDAQARIEARLVELNARLEARFLALGARIGRREKETRGRIPAERGMKGRR